MSSPADQNESATVAGEHPRVRVSAFVVVDARVLLVRQHRSAERGAPPYWLLPGGAVEFGETLAAALTREVDEELGVRITPGDPIALLESISPDQDYRKHVLHVILPARWPEKAAREPQPRDKHVLEARFFPADELDDLQLRPPVAGTLARWLERRPLAMEYLGRLW
jgi:ADP-ribose pyrophosphatase YjhB (NUDIX family)